MIMILVCYCGPVPRYLIYIIMVTRQVSHLSTLHASTKLSQPTLRYDTNHTQLQLLVCFYIYLCFISMPDECFMNMMCIWQCVSERAVNETSRKFRNDNMQTKLPVSGHIALSFRRDFRLRCKIRRLSMKILK